MVREVVSAADRAADVGRGAGAAQFHSLLARYCSGGETDADVGTTGLFRSEPVASGAARTGMVLNGAWRWWWSTSSSRALCLRQGSVARRQWPVPKPQLVAPGPVQYRRGNIRTSSATPGPPTARTNAPPSSPHPATTRSLRGRVIWSLVFVEDTSRVRGRSFTRGDMPSVRGQDSCTHSRRMPPSVYDAPVDEATSHLLTQPFSLEVSRLWTRGSSRLRMGLGRRSRSGNRRGCLARTVVRFIAGVFMVGVQWDRLAQTRL